MSRPSTYTDDLPAMLTAHIDQGGTVSAFALSRGLERRTLYNWQRAYPEFAVAMASSPVRHPAEPPPVTAQPSTAAVFSLAAWGVPMRPIPADGISPRTMTEDDVDDLLARAA